MTDELAEFLQDLLSISFLRELNQSVDLLLYLEAKILILARCGEIEVSV